MSEIRLLMEKWDTYLREIEISKDLAVDLKAIQTALTDINTTDEFKSVIELVLAHTHPNVDRQRVFNELMGSSVGSQLEKATNPETRLRSKKK